MIGTESPQVPVTSGDLARRGRRPCAGSSRAIERQGSGTSIRASSSRPATPKRSATGTGWPKVMSVAWMRFFKAVRWRTRWRRKRARSRSARTVGSGSQIVGHEVPAGELGEDPGVDACRSWRRAGASALDLDRVGDRDVPAAELELVVDEAGSGHRLDGRTSPPGRAAGHGDTSVRSASRIGADGGHLDRPTLLIRGRARRASGAIGPIRRTTSPGPPGAGCLSTGRASPIAASRACLPSRESPPSWTLSSPLINQSHSPGNSTERRERVGPARPPERSRRSRA